MTQAPEKIWAWPDAATGSWYEGGSSNQAGFADGEKGYTKYIRADLVSRWHRIDDPENPPPMDGTPVRLYRPKSTIGQWDQEVTAVWRNPYWMWPDSPANNGWWEDPDFWAEEGYGDFFYGLKEFTHWRPIPTPPEEE